MQSLSFQGITRSDLIDSLHFRYGTRQVIFRYELLDRDDTKIKELYNVVGGEVSMASLSTIKRTARLNIVDNDQSIDWLNHRIKIYAGIPVKNSFCEWPLGIFILSTPKRSEKDGVIYRSIEAYDGIQVLLDDKMDSRYTVLAGSNYVETIVSILRTAGITKYNIDSSGLACPISKEWDIGTSKITIINELLNELSYTSMWVDENGYYTSHKYMLPSQRSIEYTYTDDQLSIIGSNAEHEVDYFNVPNKWIVVSSNPDSMPLVSTYVNNNISSKTSTVNRGRVITDYRQIDNIADQASLDSYCLKIAFEASQIFEYMRFETAIMPFHSFDDVLGINHSRLNVSDKFVETNWTIPLNSGGMMKHAARKVVMI